MIFNLLSLQTLNLSNNNLSSLRPEMQYLNNLTDLDVSCNQLSACMHYHSRVNYFNEVT